MAWISSRAKIGKDDKQSRADLLAGSDVLNIEPEESIHWLIILAKECGLSISNGMGIVEMSWSEIASWMTVTKIEGIWLAKTVKMLSKVFVSAYFEYDGQSLGVSPMQDVIGDELKNAIIQNQFDKFVKG